MLDFFSKFRKIDEMLRILDPFFQKDYITLKDFPGDWTDSFTVMDLKFVSKMIFSKIYKNYEKIKINWEKLTNSFDKKNKSFIRLFIEIIFQFVNNFWQLLSCKINILNILNMARLFSDFYFIEKYFKFPSNLIFGWESTCHTSLIAGGNSESR